MKHHICGLNQQLPALYLHLVYLGLIPVGILISIKGFRQFYLGSSSAFHWILNPFTNSRKRNAPVRVTVESLYDSSQAQSSVLERAKKIEASLDHKFPSLLKVMMPSEVSGGFCLNLAKKFRSEYMPKQDSMIVLEDAKGKEFGRKYLVEKGGLSGGWRGFSIAHKIMKGDVVIFHLVAPFKFEVYIVRSNEVDWSLPLMRVDPPIRRISVVSCFKTHQVMCGKWHRNHKQLLSFLILACDLNHAGGFTACGKEERENLEPIPQENAIVCYTDSGPTSDQSENDGEDVGSEFLDGLRLSESVVTFKEVHCLDNFHYYEFFCSQNSFLHEQLVEGLNCKLIAGVISETVNIADAIRACKITTLEGYLSTWDKTLKAFDDLGMNVCFPRARLDQLTSVASKQKRLEANVLEVKEAMNSLDSEIETPNTSLEEREILFQEMAKAPW
ncbi:hypothetical protein ACFX2H_034245 [Malus domestica]